LLYGLQRLLEGKVEVTKNSIFGFFLKLALQDPTKVFIRGRFVFFLRKERICFPKVCLSYWDDHMAHGRGDAVQVSLQASGHPVWCRIHWEFEWLLIGQLMLCEDLQNRLLLSIE
jgi:hypothetical protein